MKRKIINLIALGVLASCSHTAEKRVDYDHFYGYYKVGNPYKIKGKWYHPKEYGSYEETGVASWYGPNFHGKLTANGDRFDQNEITAAHKTLPLPSVVRVTNLENGRSLELVVNDRGPYAHQRIIDLSKHSAQKLGFKEKGTAKVRVTLLEDKTNRLLAGIPGAEQAKERHIARRDGNKTIHGQAGERWYVQAGSFSVKDNAENAKEKFTSFGKVDIHTTSNDGRVFHQLRLGPLKDEVQAQDMLQRLANAGHRAIIINED